MTKLHIFRITLISILLTVTSQLAANELPGYRLAADDEISMSVFGEPELSIRKTLIAINGNISVPLIGQVNLKNLTTSEAEEHIKKRFSGGYLINPAISISIIKYRQFYVNGEVKNPGGYNYRDGMNVQKAVTLAGGFSERADKDDITIAHENSTDSPEKATITDTILPGDIVTIDESFF